MKMKWNSLNWKIPWNVGFALPVSVEKIKDVYINKKKTFLKFDVYDLSIFEC